MRILRQNSWHVIEINVAACADERGFLDKLEIALKEKLGTGGFLEPLKLRLSALLNRVKSVKIPTGAGSLGVELQESTESWTDVGSEILKLIAELENRWLIYIDELPILLYTIIRTDPASGAQRVRRFLDWFRNDVRGLPETSRIRWLLSGSVGLDTLVQQHGMSDTINTLTPASLDPFSKDEAAALMTILADNYQLAITPADITALLELIGWLQPYYLQRAFSELRSLMNANPDQPAGALLELAVNGLATPGKDNDFNFWQQRLSMQLNASDARHAVTLLTASAARPHGVDGQRLVAILQEKLPTASDDDVLELFVRLRDILIRDGYWANDSSAGHRRYRFALEPLRRWWQRRYEL